MKDRILKGSVILVFSTLYLLTLYSCKKEDPNAGFDKLDILDKIKTLEGVTVTEIEPKNGYPREFQIDIIQPVDHNNPGGAKFTQRAYLSHVSDTMPVIFAPNGYRSTASSSQELALQLKTNCLNVTHRYFTDS